MSHTKEPWVVSDAPAGVLSVDITCSEGFLVASAEIDDDACRIVACVNACAGMPDPAAEIAALRAEVERLRKFSDKVFCVMSSASSDLAEIDEAMAELEAAAPAPSQSADAEDAALDSKRLDFIESQCRVDPKMDGNHVYWPTSFNHRLTGPNLRAAIDAARAKRGES